MFFFKYTTTTEIYPLSLPDALPILAGVQPRRLRDRQRRGAAGAARADRPRAGRHPDPPPAARRRVARGAGRVHAGRDRKSTRLNSSHANISYAVFCLKKKNIRYLIL